MGMVVMHPLVSVVDKRMARGAEADAPIAHEMDRGAEQDQEGDRLRRRRSVSLIIQCVCLVCY